MGNDFIRASTTLSDGNADAAGTVLDHGNPAYKNLIEGKRYTGEVTLFGKGYMADFNVFKDKNGQVVGAYLVGIPMSN